MKIAELVPHCDEIAITGCIIRKQDARCVKVKRDNTERGIWGFTLRDTYADYINVTAWGSVEWANKLCAEFELGDIVDLVNAKVTFRKIGDLEEKNTPSVTSSFTITLNEGQSEIKKNTLTECEGLKKVLRIPTKPIGNYLSLADLNTHGRKLLGKNINLLAAVGSVGSVREVMSSTGNKCQVREITLIDETHSGILFSIWDKELSKQADKWTPRMTILFLADVSVRWSAYRNCVTVSATRCTIITEDPLMAPADNLKKYAITAPVEPVAILNTISLKIHDPCTIQNVMSCAAVLQKATCKDQKDEFTALVYGIIHWFDIDGINSITTTKCTFCKKKVDENEGCVNDSCPSGMGIEVPSTDLAFDIRIKLSDHTGTITNCRLSEVIARKLIEGSASDFMNLTAAELTEIKWKYLFKYTAARLVVLPANRPKHGVMISVIDIQLVSLAEYSAHLPVC